MGSFIFQRNKYVCSVNICELKIYIVSLNILLACKISYPPVHYGEKKQKISCFACFQLSILRESLGHLIFAIGLEQILAADLIFKIMTCQLLLVLQDIIKPASENNANLKILVKMGYNVQEASVALKRCGVY